jgi:hypothetical protein
MCCFAVLSLLIAGCSPSDTEQDSEPEYSADVPEFLLTPDKVTTELLGDLDFFDGMPSDATVEKVRDFLDLSRGVETFLNAMPAVSMYAMLEGIKEAGAAPGGMVIFEDLMDARSLFLTGNSTTVYAMAELDLKEEPIVVEVPPAVLGFVDDAFFRYVSDVGVIGPDQGQGGRYLFVGPDYEGEIPEGYFVARSPSYRHWLLMRAFVIDGDTRAAADGVKAGFNSYPLSMAQNPPQARIIDGSGKRFNTIHASDGSFFAELNEVIQYEPADAFNPELLGFFASIGIKQGEPFAPDARMERLLNEAAAIANASSRAILFRSRNSAAFFYPDRQWLSPFAGGSHEFLNNGERVLDDRTMMFYAGTGITPAMTRPRVGAGSAYEVAATDSDGRYLDGGKTYQVTLPAPIPINNFWSFMVYSGQHRSMLETDQKFAGLDSNNPSVKPNTDGSYTMWFGPEAPKGHEGNWIQTMPDKSYFVVLRLYGPLKPWFDKTWKPGDFEKIK